VGSVPDNSPTVPSFDEFERPAPKESDAWTPSPGTGPDKNSDNPDEPSLGYLFTPFDPGKVEEAKFREDFKDLPPPENYEYVQMDTRDTGIVKTLEMATKKAAEIVASAFEQGRRMEEKVLEAAKVDAQEIEDQAKAQAQSIMAEAQKTAQSQAEAILSQAKNQVVEIESQKTEIEALKAQTQELKNQADQVLARVLEREAALAPREAEIDQIKAEIEGQKQQILDQAKLEAEAAKAQASAQGLAEGRTKGQEQGTIEAKKEILAKAQGFFQMIGRLNGLWQELWQRNAPFMVSLAVEAAEAIVNKEIKNGQGLAAGAFSACVDFLRKCNVATFRVRPEDLQEIEEARNALRDKVDGLVNVTFKTDASLGPGDIIMESDAGLLDATVKTRRDRVMSVLRQALEDGLVAELPPDISAPMPPESTADPVQAAASPEAAQSGASPEAPEAPEPPQGQAQSLASDQAPASPPEPAPTA
jgi:flagellar biosynthesis/type III secretory pathway protein FliH